MKILDYLEIVDLGLKYKENFIIGDLHIGLEEAMNKQGILIPRFQLEEILKRLKKILSKIDVKRIIINGDLKHEFGEISRQEWNDTLKVLDFLLEKYEVVLVKGNHDKILEPIANKKNLKVVDSYSIDDILIVHGDKIVPNLKKIIIMGHIHPAVNLEGRKFKCFLKGKYKKHDIVVLPSFNFVNEGSNIINEKMFSPFLEKINDFEVFVVEDKVYYFGKIKELKEI